MMQLMKKAKSFSIMGLLAVFALGSNLGLVPSATAHAMEGMDHSSNASITCSTICNSATFKKEDHFNEKQKIQDNEPALPFYAQLQADSLNSIEKQHSQSARSAVSREQPPGGPPAYITLGVFRI